MRIAEVNPAFKFLFSYIIFITLIEFSKCEKVESDSRTQTTVNSLWKFEKGPKITCESHTNCSSRILTLDTYCCPSSKHCCNWFEFAAKYKSESTVPLKAPSILTILAICLLIICFLFVCYCFSILFCFCFKCGIFKRPKVVILSQLHGSESGLFTNENNSPKHSTSTTSSASSNSSYVPSRRHHHRQSSSSHKSHKKRAHNRHRSARSPTARTYSNKRPQYDAEIYVDFDSNPTNESPFLIPPELNDHVQQRVNRSLNAQNDINSSNRNANQSATPSAPLEAEDSHIEINERHASNRRSNLNNNNILEPVISSSLSVSTNSSLGFGASLRDQITNEEETAGRATSSAIPNSPAVPVQNYQYHDEKPPSYEDIIKRNY